MGIDSSVSARTVLWLVDLVEGELWLNGGWGVDALVGHQTRDHEDIDIVIEERRAAPLVRHLRGLGFVDVPWPDTRPCNFVLGAPGRGRIDFHLVRFDGAGNGLYGIPEPEDVFPAYAFTGRGRILGREVRCMSAAYQVESHDTGYALRDKDFADMAALARATGVALPARLRG